MNPQIKNFVGRFFDLDTIRQFYFPLKGNKLKLRFVKSKFKFLGKRTYIDFPVKLKGRSNISIGDDVVINAFVHIWGHGGVEIGNRVMIAAHTSITSLTHDYNLKDMHSAPAVRSKVIIEDDVWIGSNVVIMPGITIEKGAVIGAGAVVTKNVKSNSIVVGNPAVEIRKRIINE